MMQVCEVIYGRERGAALATFVEAATGEPCPCRRGLVCPMMPAVAAEAEPPIASAPVPR